ncbi:zinc-binding dehydrogenase [bacterium]|nr:zinc-binding dehydrogenase [bacterium]
MKVVIAHRTGQARVVDLPEPKSSRGCVTVRVSHSAVQLPDELFLLEAAPKSLKRGQDGVPIGSGASGTILDVGSGVETLKAGLRVAVYGLPYAYHAGQLVVPENMVVELPKKVNHEEGSFAGQGALALNLLRSADVRLGETMLIFGADLVGLLLAQLVRAAGATPIVVDESDYRLTKAKAVGIAHTHQRIDDQLVQTVTAVTDGYGVDSAVLMRRDQPGALKGALEMIREGGALVLGAPIRESVDLPTLREKGARIITAAGGGPGAGDPDFERRGSMYPRPITRWTVRDNMACFCAQLAERKVQVSPLVTDRVPLDRAQMAYEKAARGRDAVLGVVLTT